MLPKIGLKTDNIFNSTDKLDFEVLELLAKDRNLAFNIKKILKAKEFLKGKDLSMHTQTSRLFSCFNYGIPSFNDAELKVLQAEIIICEILGISELIFHLKQEILTDKEKDKLQALFDFASAHKVEMIYESNNDFSAKTCLNVLEGFSTLNYNLDLGHLNTAIGNNTLGMELEDFLSKVRARIVYIHAHNNNGIKDEHKSLEKGTLDWERVLDCLDLTRIRKIIMEVKCTEDIVNSKKLLEDYLKARS